MNLAEKLAAYDAIVRRCQGTLARALQDGGLDDKAALSEMAAILDGPEVRDLRASPDAPDEYEVIRRFGLPITMK